jgi:hypothetical protein
MTEEVNDVQVYEKFKMFRRQVDIQILDALDFYHKEIPKIERELTTKYERLEKSITAIDSNLKLLIQRIDISLIPKIENHESILHGDPHDTGQRGLINQVHEVQKDVGFIKTVGASIWGVAVVITNLIVGGLISYFTKKS